MYFTCQTTEGTGLQREKAHLKSVSEPAFTRIIINNSNSGKEGEKNKTNKQPQGKR